MDNNMKRKSARMEEGIILVKSLPAEWRREHSKHNALCGTIHDSHENEK